MESTEPQWVWVVYEYEYEWCMSMSVAATGVGTSPSSLTSSPAPRTTMDSTELRWVKATCEFIFVVFALNMRSQLSCKCCDFSCWLRFIYDRNSFKTSWEVSSNVWSNLNHDPVKTLITPAFYLYRLKLCQKLNHQLVFPKKNNINKISKNYIAN